MVEKKTGKYVCIKKLRLNALFADILFHKEEMMTGGGRLNAGDLTTELRRLYIPSKKIR